MMVISPNLLAAAGGDVSLLWAIPFAVLLSCVAVLPVVAHHWWGRHYPKVAITLGAVVAVYYLFVRHEPEPWLHEMREYVSFVALLGSLYFVSGGIAIRVNRRATPRANSVLLLIGAVLANLIGTTGAAMLLIRPYLRMNRGHLRPYHVVFFIFVVANVGGGLTPIGDPPLFLGYLRGVPFWWIGEQMLAPWAVAVGLLVGTFAVIDVIDNRRSGQGREPSADGGPQVHVLGVHNFLFVAVVLWGVFRPSGFDVAAEIDEGGATAGRVLSLVFSREAVMVAAAVASRLTTAARVYEVNLFTLAPIREVAILFVGIFSTMVPALGWLNGNAQRLGVRTAGQYYFACGTLSAVLDNAPTYLTFMQMQLSALDPAEVDRAAAVIEKMKGRDGAVPDVAALETEQGRAAVEAVLRYGPRDVRRGTVTRERLEVSFLLGLPGPSRLLLAICAASVFWGACTYIGNGPNFMVKSIADAGGFRTPSFFEYVIKYTLPILIPIYLLVWAVFFR